MTGLLLKDGYTMLRQAKFFLVMIVILEIGRASCRERV